MTDLSPAEQIAETRRDLDDTIQAWRNRRSARAVLMVGGPLHGEIRALGPDERTVLVAASMDDPEVLTSLASGTPVSSRPVNVRHSRYRREEYATRDGDTATTVEVWHHEDVTPGSPEGYRLAAGAALKALASTGMIDSHTRTRHL